MTIRIDTMLLSLRSARSSRRSLRALRVFFASFAVLLTCATSHAAAARIPDFSFVHCSDIHVPAGVARRTGAAEGPLFGSAEVVAQIRGLTGPVALTPYRVTAPPPAFAIATGDVTEFGGLKGAWEQYLGLWAGAPFSVYHVEGNHDATWACQRFHIRELHGGTFYSFDRFGCHFVGLDSATPQDPRPSFGEDQLRWLRSDLKPLSPETPVFLCFHHPLHSNEFASPLERDRLLDLLRPYNVALLLVGHGHRAEHRVIAGIDQVMGGSTFGAAPGYAVVAVQGGVLRVAYRRAAEPDAAQPLLERPLAPRAHYPRIRIDAPRDGRPLPGSRLRLQARIAALEIVAARWQADDAEALAGVLEREGETWRGEVDTSAWTPGGHYVRFTFQDRQGESYQRTVVCYTGEDTARVRWRHALGAASKSTPAVDGDTLYVGANDGTLHALDVATGRWRWRFRTGGEILAAPLVREGRIYCGSGDGKFYALDRRGRLLWTFTAGAPVYSSAVWADGLVLFGANDARFFALDAATGALCWVSNAPGYAVESRPCVAEGAVYFGAWDSHVYALDLADGHLRWKTMAAGSAASAPGVAPYYSPADAGPVVAGGRVFIADRAYKLTVLDATSGAVLQTRDGVAATALAEDGRGVYLRGTDGRLRKIDADGREQWAVEAPVGFLPTAPREAGGAVFTVNGTGLLAALDAADGRVRWRYQITPRLFVFADPVPAGDTVYTVGTDGVVTAVWDRRSEGVRG